MNRISDEERRALLDEARKLAESAKFETGLCLRLASDAERNALAFERRRRAASYDEDDPNAHHGHSRSNPRPPCQIIPFPIRRRLSHV
jgi:hypothetical protein